MSDCFKVCVNVSRINKLKSFLCNHYYFCAVLQSEKCGTHCNFSRILDSRFAIVNFYRKKDKCTTLIQGLFSALILHYLNKISYVYQRHFVYLNCIEQNLLPPVLCLRLSFNLNSLIIHDALTSLNFPQFGFVCKRSAKEYLHVHTKDTRITKSWEILGILCDSINRTDLYQFYELHIFVRNQLGIDTRNVFEIFSVDKCLDLTFTSSIFYNHYRLENVNTNK
jgi:hypothetical protein